MNQQILSQVSGGREHDTVYLAGVDQNSALATLDVSSVPSPSITVPRPLTDFGPTLCTDRQHSQNHLGQRS